MDARTPFAARNPRTGRRLPGAFPLTSATELEAGIREAVEAQTGWAEVGIPERVAFCRGVAEGLRSRRGELAEVIVAEVGKLEHEALAEVDKCADLCDHYGGSLAAALRATPISVPGTFARVVPRPLGVLLGIMPWNFPLWQAARFAIPALAAGNAVVVKHATNVPGSAEAFARLLQSVLPDGVYVSVRLGNEATEGLIADVSIAGVSLTGGTRAGRSVGAAAGRALRPSVLELGGSDAYLVLEDADLDLAAERLVRGRLVNAGQSCIGPKRIVVVDAVREAFTARVVALARRYAFAGLDPDSPTEREVAPLARADLRDELHRQVTATRDAGARLLLGGEIPAGPGYYYPVTLLTDVPAGSPAYEEELFGPVLAILAARDEAHAIAIANDSRYALGAGVFSRDVARAETIAVEKLRAGATAVNDFVRSDPRVPFGGVGDSGYGRELGREGLLAFCNLKSVTVAPPA